MNRYLKFGAAVLATLLLASCGETPQATQTTQTEPVAEATEEMTQATTSTEMRLDTEAALRSALETTGRVVMEGDIAVETGVVVKGNLLIGDGYVLTAPVYNEEDPETSCGIFIAKGNIENITVKGGYRAIGTASTHRNTGDIRLTNVVADGENCALYIGHADNKGSVNAKNCTFGGQTVFNKVTYAMFENCTFTFNESQTKGNITAYADTTLVNCHFEGIEGKRYTLAFAKKVDNYTMVLENCYVGDTLITEENISELLTVREHANKIVVRNTDN